MDGQTISVNLGSRSYEIVIGDGCLADAGSWLNTRVTKVTRSLIVTDDNVRSHADEVAGSVESIGWAPEVVSVAPGEASKSLEVAESLYDCLIGMQADRHTPIVAVGGGVVGDAAGFVAATFSRGVPFVQVPTTLLADVDSSVGGKVAVNHRLAKNMIGAFYQPAGVLIDTAVLKTLPDRDYVSGLAEVVKYGVISDANFFSELEQNVVQLNARDTGVLTDVIARSCRIKADVVERDEFERTGLRAALNYGHTFAHAFESLSGYGLLLHGEAVSIGMVFAATLAARLGRIDSEIVSRQSQLLQSLELPTSLPSSLRLSPRDVMERMTLDKKAVGGRLRFVLPSRLGSVDLVDNVPRADVDAVLTSLL